MNKEESKKPDIKQITKAKYERIIKMASVRKVPGLLKWSMTFSYYTRAVLDIKAQITTGWLNQNVNRWYFKHPEKDIYYSCRCTRFKTPQISVSIKQLNKGREWNMILTELHENPDLKNYRETQCYKNPNTMEFDD